MKPVDTPRRRLRFGVLGLAFWTVSLGAQEASGPGLFPPTKQDYQVLWRELEADSRAGSWERVLESLEVFLKLIDTPEENFVVAGGGGISLGVRRLLARHVDRLPPVYRERFQGRLDARLLEPWTRAADDPGGDARGTLRRLILRDYPQSSFIIEALQEEIDLSLLEGDWYRARRAADRLLEEAARADGRLPLEELVALRLIALQIAQALGDGSSWNAHRRELRALVERLGPDARLPGEWSAPLAKALESEFEPLAAPSARRVSAGRGPSPAGDAANSFLDPLARTERLAASASSRGGPAYRPGGVIWRRQAADPDLRRFVRERRLARDGSPRPHADVPLPFFPSECGGIVVLQHESQIVAYDLEGLRQRWAHLLGAPGGSTFSAVRAPLCSQGTVFVVHAGEVRTLDLETGEKRWARRLEYDASRQALELSSATEGPPVPRPDGEAEPPRPVRPGPAVLHGDGLIVPVEVRAGTQVLTYLVRLDSGGELVWRTYLGSAHNSDFLGLGPAASPPRVVGGTLVHLTNLGFLAAVDPADGAILWLKEYNALSPRGEREAIRDERRWHPNPIVPLSGGEVLVAPQDSTLLAAVRVRDGETSWQLDREEHSSLIGCIGPRCFLSGIEIEAVSIADSNRGETIWRTRLPEGARPQGRSVLLEDRILVSSTDELLQVDTRTGEVVSRDLWEFSGAGGNLLLARDRLAVIHPGGFLVYNDYESESRRLAATAQDPNLWLRRARLHLRRGELGEGLRALETWVASKPVPPRANSADDQLHLETAEVLSLAAARAPPDMAARLLEFRVLVEGTPARKVAATLELGLLLEQNADPTGALRAFYRALEIDAERPAQDAPPGADAAERGAESPVERIEYLVEGFLPVPARDFARERIRTIRDQAPDPAPIFAEVESRARAALESARQRATIYAYRQMLEVYPYTQAAALALEDLATAYADHRNAERAAQCLLDSLRDFPRQPNRLEISLKAAHLLYESGKRAQAKRLYQEILDSQAEGRVAGVHGMEAGETAGSYIRRRLSDPGLAETDAEALKGLKVPLRMVWRSPADLLSPDKKFLKPEGLPPATARGAFFTQSSETIECRDLEDGTARWTVHLQMVPGFQLESLQHPAIRFARAEEREIRGRFVGELLVLYDDRNLFAIDVEKGKVLWNVPFGSGGAAEPARPAALRPIPRLGEVVRGVLATESGVFATTSHRRVRSYDLEGRERWERTLVHDPAPVAPVVAGGEVFVLSDRPLAYHAFALDGSGAPAGSFEILEERAHDRRLAGSEPIALPRGRVLLALSKELLLLDLARRSVIWRYDAGRATIQRVFYFEDAPNEAVVAINRANNWPALIGVRLVDGREGWRYEKFPAERARIWVFRDGHQLFVVHGGDLLRLLALETRPVPGQARSRVAPLWPDREISLGAFFHTGDCELHIAENALFFPSPWHSISIYDRAKGQLLIPPPNNLAEFLVEKRSHRSSVVEGTLVLLTDGGDCAFRARDLDEDHSTPKAALLREYIADPSDIRVLSSLALSYFRDGDFATAIRLLDKALASEAVLSTASAKEQGDLAFLLEGIKQEAMKGALREEVVARRFTVAPVIDGRLDDAWNYAHRVRMTTPRHLNLIAAPGVERRWEGEEDLSAVLYTGWDDRYFYFALDVEDDVLRAYDRDAEYWRGDCLLIGLDPNGDGGYRQGSDDQLMTLALTIPKRNNKAKDRDDEKEGEEGEDEEDEDQEEEDANRPDGLFSVQKKDDSSGAVYEVALPWTSFPRFTNGPPPAGVTFGLSLLLTDDDSGGGATKTLSLNPCHLIPRKQRNFFVWRFLIPEFFPRIRLR